MLSLAWIVEQTWWSTEACRCIDGQKKNFIKQSKVEKYHNTPQLKEEEPSKAKRRLMHAHLLFSKEVFSITILVNRILQLGREDDTNGTHWKFGHRTISFEPFIRLKTRAWITSSIALYAYLCMYIIAWNHIITKWVFPFFLLDKTFLSRPPPNLPSYSPPEKNFPLSLFLFVEVMWSDLLLSESAVNSSGKA